MLPSEGSATDGRADGVTARRGLWTVQVSLIVLAIFALPTLSLDLVRPLVPFDERAHIDYVFKLSDATIPTWGSTLDDRTLALSDCLSEASTDEGCVGDWESVRESRGPYSYQAQQPPLGYVPMAIANRAMTDPNSFHFLQILLLRATNLLTFGFFAIFWALSLSYLIQSRLIAAAVSALLIANPWFYGAFTYVTNDAAAITSGMALVAGLLTWLRASRVPRDQRFVVGTSLAFFAFGSASALIKLTAVLPLLALTLAVLVSGSRHSSLRKTLPRLLPVAPLLLGFVLTHTAYSAWRNANSSTTETEVISELLGPSSRSLAEAAVSRLNDLSTISFGWEPYQIGPITPWTIALGLLSCALLVWALGSAKGRFPSWLVATPQSLVASALFFSILMLMAVPVVLYLQGPFEPSYIGRYLVPLLPLYALSVAALLREHQRVAPPVLAFSLVILLFFSAPGGDFLRNL